MSKCMVAFIDWYHERFDGEGGREKIKVNINTQIKNENTNTQRWRGWQREDKCQHQIKDMITTTNMTQKRDVSDAGPQMTF